MERDGPLDPTLDPIRRPLASGLVTGANCLNREAWGQHPHLPYLHPLRIPDNLKPDFTRIGTLPLLTNGVVLLCVMTDLPQIHLEGDFLMPH